MSLQKSIFYFKVPDNTYGSNFSYLVSELNNDDFIGFLKENGGQRLKIKLSVAIEKENKESMYEYYHKVILGVAIRCYESIGWESMDKVKADNFLKNECAKDIAYNPKLDKQVIFLEDKSLMTKKRLHKFLSDCIIFLEQEFQARVPDSNRYRLDSTKTEGFIKV